MFRSTDITTTQTTTTVVRGTAAPLTGVGTRPC